MTSWSLLEEARKAEREQTLLYRALAARAEQEGDVELAQRFHDLHADEQHHLSRLTARILELGGQPAELAAVRPEAVLLEGWAVAVRERETAEIARYRRLLEHDLDPETRALITQILSVEEHHEHDLGGKWTMA